MIAMRLLVRFVFFYYRSGEVVTGRLRCRAYVLRLSFNRGGSENIIAARSGLVSKGVLILQVVKRRLLGLLVVLEPRCNAATSAGCKNSKSTMLTGQSWTELFRLPESSANHHHFPSSLPFSSHFHVLQLWYSGRILPINCIRRVTNRSDVCTSPLNSKLVSIDLLQLS
jgi:hypothetical protein